MAVQARAAARLKAAAGFPRRMIPPIWRDAGSFHSWEKNSYENCVWFTMIDVNKILMRIYDYDCPLSALYAPEYDTP